MGWTDSPIMPTPGAVGDIMQRVAQARNITLVGVDIGGATTDVFSVFRSKTPPNPPVSYKKTTPPTPPPLLAEGNMENRLLLCGGELDTVFNRTVSANLGMSYSVMNVLAEAGIENILRWVPFEINEGDLTQSDCQ